MEIFIQNFVAHYQSILVNFCYPEVGLIQALDLKLILILLQNDILLRFDNDKGYVFRQLVWRLALIF